MNNTDKAYYLLPFSKKSLQLDRLFSLLIFICFYAIGLSQNATEPFPPKPNPKVLVHDYSNWLTPHERTTLEYKLQYYADSTSTQIVVMIRPDIGEYDRFTYAYELGKRWGVGQDGKDNGAVMLIVTEPPNRGAFIATGYGLEGALPDGLLGAIVRQRMIPNFKAGQYYQGVTMGLDSMIAALSGEYEATQSQSIPLWVLFLIILFVLFIFIAINRASDEAATYDHDGKTVRRTIHHPHRRREGWHVGGGGWGNSGGGGFGGGGFGGGSFGGGGAGGGW